MLFERVKRYSDVYGPLGNEDEITAVLEADWGHKADTMLTSMGNLVAHVAGPGPKLLIQTHCDEIGSLVKAITSTGFLRPTAGYSGSEVDAPPDPWLQMQRVKVRGAGGWVDGVMGLSTGHVRTAKQRDQNQLQWDDLFVDIGATSREDVEEHGIEVGAPIIYASACERLGQYVIGKALDARAGLAIMTELLERLDPRGLQYDLYLGATIQEEMGLIGATSMAEFGYDLLIGVEVGLAGDIPTVPADHLPTKLGAGPVIVVKDAYVHYDRRTTERVKDVARANDIPYQLAVFQQYASDLREFMARGVPSALVTFATRYTHSPWEMASLNDMEQIVDLLLAFVET